MEVKNVEFPELETTEQGNKINQRSLGDIPVQVTVELGQTQMNLKDVLELAEGSIIELDHFAGEPLALKVGDQLIAKGEVVAIDDYYGLRITNVLIK
ncbi:MAG: flagellar motor switch protein FliN [bacterium]